MADQMTIEVLIRKLTVRSAPFYELLTDGMNVLSMSNYTLMQEVGEPNATIAKWRYGVVEPTLSERNNVLDYLLEAAHRQQLI